MLDTSRANRNAEAVDDSLAVDQLKTDTSQNKLLQHVVSVCNVDKAKAQEMLEAASWSVVNAVNSYCNTCPPSPFLCFYVPKC